MDSFKNLHTHSHEVMTEISKLKDTYRKQCETFVYEVQKLDGHIIEHTDRLHQRCNHIDTFVNDHKVVL